MSVGPAPEASSLRVPRALRQLALLWFVVALVAGGCTLSRNGELLQECTIGAECELPNPCYVATCSSTGRCVFTPTDNSAVLAQTPNDCAVNTCVIAEDEAAPTLLAADDDRPADIECQTKYTCNDGELSESGVAPGTPCGAGGQGLCQEGSCVVACDLPDDPRCDDGNVCTRDVCDLTTNACVQEPIDNVDAPTQTSGDCHLVLCVLGNASAIYDDLDVFDDGSECTVDTCNSGQPVNTPEPAGTSCSGPDPLASVCDPFGSCVQCNADSECLGFMPGWDDSDCQTPRCVAGTCELFCEPLGVVADAQSPQPDCHTVVCDGACGYANTIDDNDVLVDANDCTGDSCNAGTIEHPPEAANTPCGTAGLCDGNGNCGACNVDSDCQADTFCSDWSCDTAQDPHLCVAANINEGVDLPTQTGGDCHTQRCVAGAPANQIDDTDLPVDPFECTFDTCTGGVAANPPRPIDDLCNEPGGRFCDGNGACVDCNDVTQCSGSDGVCEHDACVANSCVIEPETTQTNAPPSCQSPSPDCQVVKCDGMGACGLSVPDNADVVDDANACTFDSCSAGAEVHDSAPLEGALCAQNAAFCDGPETCQTGACLPSGNPCPGHQVGPACNDSCDETNDNCNGSDGNAVACNDGSFCNGGDTCNGLGTCVNTGVNPCAGQDVGPLCNDSCRELGSGTGDCTAPDSNTTSCDDATFCNGSDTCDGAGTCQSAGNPCPGHDVGPGCADSCNESADDCTAPDSNTTSCDDGTFCNGSDTCDGAGTCQSAGNPCPGHDVGPSCDDSCNESAGDCTGFDASTTSCDDGLFCTGTDSCDGGGSCVSTGDPCDGPDGDAQCAETCDELANDCLGVDPNGSDCGAGNVCIAATCSDVRVVFVTSSLFDGDDLGSALDGDMACAARASAAGLSGVFMAWMSDGTTSPSARFAGASVPYVLLDGSTVATDYADLIDGSLATAIDVNELGATVATTPVWTGTLEDGTAATSHCLGWASTAAVDVGLSGSSALTAAGWSNDADSACADSYPLYCFEQ